jgi:hypothetical protein
METRLSVIMREEPRGVAIYIYIALVQAAGMGGLDGTYKRVHHAP